MKKNGLQWTFFLVFVLLVAAPAQAKKTQKSIYAFAVAECFRDTVVCMTEIQLLDDAQQQRKTKFLLGRNAYSQQFKDHLMRQMGLPNRMVALFFSKKRSKVEKRFQKVRKRYLADKKVSLVIVPASDFRFQSIGSVYDNNAASQKSTALPRE